MKKHCVPCEGGVAPLAKKQIDLFLAEVPPWTLSDGKLQQMFLFKAFAEALRFVNAVAVLAEKEGHHPDILVQWNKVTLTLWTHAVKRLTENDFVMAKKISGI